MYHVGIDASPPPIRYRSLMNDTIDTYLIPDRRFSLCRYLADTVTLAFCNYFWPVRYRVGIVGIRNLGHRRRDRELDTCPSRYHQKMLGIIPIRRYWYLGCDTESIPSRFYVVVVVVTLRIARVPRARPEPGRHRECPPAHRSAFWSIRPPFCAGWAVGSASWRLRCRT